MNGTFMDSFQQSLFGQIDFVTFFILLAIMFTVYYIVKHAENFLYEYIPRNILNHKFIKHESLYEMLTDDEFNSWCKQLLLTNGYEEIAATGSLASSGVSYTARRDSKNYFILTNLADSTEYESVTIDELNTFVGSMLQNNISHGVIISTYDFTDELLEFIELLPNSLNIELLNGSEISDLHNTQYLNKFAAL